MDLTIPRNEYNLLTYAAYTRLRKKGNDAWSLLSKEDQELAALWILERDMHNGGFLRFIGNAGDQCITYAMRALRKIEAKECLKALIQLSGFIESLKSFFYHVRASDIASYLTDEERASIDSQNLNYRIHSNRLNEKIFREYSPQKNKNSCM
ncbi:DMP19 family protein [Niabella sp. CC-SYL272]|uniref:DMP19 family protein n=1 Tax=Niabella agricola TaxID=2891571 RepID=UPI001F2973AB|nr:DUF4375 domain-containing protein [Niabella agricola]MCF3109464.1 DMP19 family protein [Niabella agricola]